MYFQCDQSRSKLKIIVYTIDIFRKTLITLTLTSMSVTENLGDPGLAFIAV